MDVLSYLRKVPFQRTSLPLSVYDSEVCLHILNAHVAIRGREHYRRHSIKCVRCFQDVWRNRKSCCRSEENI